MVILVLCSLAGNVAGLYEALNIISYEQRPILEKTMPADDMGRTFISAWMPNNISPEHAATKEDGDEGEDFEGEIAAKPLPLIIDGIELDPVTYCAIAPDGSQLQVAKMNVKQLRAELAARQSPLRGNKRELIRQLQKARVEAEVEGATMDTKKDQSKRVEVEFVEQSYTNGNRVHEKMYKDQRLIDEDDDEEDENATVDEVEEDDEDEEGARRSALDDDDDFDFDYEDRVYSMMKAQGKFNDSISSAAPGLGEALAICRGAMAMGGIPTQADLSAIFKAAKSVNNAALKEKAEEFFADKRVADLFNNNNE